MFDQTYSLKNLAKVIRKKHIISWNMWKTDSEKNSFLQECVDEISQNAELSASLNPQTINDKIVYIPGSKKDFLRIALTDYFIRRIYKVIQADRKRIIRQIRTMLADGSTYCVLRIDIKSFYESIVFSEMIEKLEQDMYLCHEGIVILQAISQKLQLEYNTRGLPRGMGISASLSEIFMRDLDEKIKKLNGVFFYARYVDDIIIIHNENSDDIFEQVKKIIADKKLIENEKKRERISITSGGCKEHRFDFLGYEFLVKKNSKSNDVILKVSPNKINKQKRRIANAFVQYIHDHDFSMLKQRIRFLSGLVLLNKDSRGRLYAGNAHNYSEVTTSESLKALDGYMYAILHKNTNRLGKAISPILSETQKKTLLKISFYRGHKYKLKMLYTKKQSKKIKIAWAGERNNG